MAAGGSLKNIFDTPVPDSSISSWAQFLPKAETKEASFDIFGEICLPIEPESAPEPQPDSPPPEPDEPQPPFPAVSSVISPRRLDKSSSWNGSMTESDFLAFHDAVEFQDKSPSKGAVEAVKEKDAKEKVIFTRSNSARSYSRSHSMSSSKSLFPPPITSIGRFGKPRVYFKSNKEDGRFVLREVRIPTQRLLQATREDGRLRMQVVGLDEDEKEEEEERIAGGAKQQR